MDLSKLRGKAGSLIGKYKYVLVVLLVGIGLMLIPEKSDSVSAPTQTAVTVQFPDQTEALTGILSQIQGVGKVRVLLTLASGEQTVYQNDQTVDASRTNNETVILTDADRNQWGLVQKILAPQYRGAIVLCQGAGDSSVRLAVVEAVSDATGLSTDRISVLKMK